MFERFTDRARRVIVLAQDEAKLLNHNFIGTEHILLGLIHEGEGVAAKALESLGIALEAVRDQVEEIIDGGEIVVAAVSISGRGSTRGVEIRQRFFHVFEMHEGRILRLREYLDRDSALEADGLSE